jgi:xylulokinase
LASPSAHHADEHTFKHRGEPAVTLVAGVDSSTQSVKVVVCDAATGEVRRIGRAAHPPGTAVPAMAWLTAYRQATADPDLLDGVAAIAVAGQQHGMVPLDEDGDPVRDALLWNDNRSAPDAIDLIDELGGPAAWADAVGSVPVASMTVSKIRWLARAEPANAARTEAVLLPHDWLTWELGGRRFEPVTDRGDASGTCYFDPATNSYRQDLVELAFGRSLNLPRVAQPAELVGHTAEGVPLAAGTGDNMASALGLDLAEGTALVSLGTSGVAATRSPHSTHDPSGTVAGFADATGVYLPLVCTLNGARNLVAAANVLGVSLETFSELALSAQPGSAGVVFLPYLEGERTPPLPDATGHVAGLTIDSMTPANIARATVEGVLWSLAYGVQVLREHVGEIAALTLTGGAAQSRAVQQIAADVFGLPVLVPKPMESVAVGAARQAAWAITGELPSWTVPIESRHPASDQSTRSAHQLDSRYREALAASFPSLRESIALPQQ